MSFVHFHVHTEYSLLDGITQIPTKKKRLGLVHQVAALGQPAVAITDHGSLGGAYELWSECRRYDSEEPPPVSATTQIPPGVSATPPPAPSSTVKPIIGCEFNVAPDSLHNKSPYYFGTGESNRNDVGGTGAYTHLTVIADGAEGLRNLFRLQAVAFSEGFYRKPRIDLELLRAHRAGLIVLSGCLGSELQTYLKLGMVGAAEQYTQNMKDTFGDAFYIELMSHGIDIEENINSQLVEIAQYYDIPTVATNDSHFTHEDEAFTHECMLSLQTGSKLSDSGRFRFEGHGYHVRSLSEMQSLALPPESLKRTLEIAERIGSYDSVFDFSLRLPKYLGSQSLTDAVIDGLLYLNKLGDGNYTDRAVREIETFKARDVEDYPLVLADLIRRWKGAGVRVGPGRGSVGGSVVAFALGITDLDPIEEGLLFERFLDPSRVGLPDIDIDISDKDKAFRIAAEVYGENFVAHVGTNGTEKSKVAIHDAARVLGYSREISNEIAGLLPPMKFGRTPTLDEHPYFLNPGLQWPPYYKPVMDLAAELEGKVRTAGVHAAGVIISPVDLRDQLPLYKATGQGDWITQFTNRDVFPILDMMGINKYDFLGLSNLGVIDACLEMLRDGCTRGSLPLVWETLPRRSRDCDNPATYELLQSGHTLGVFQLDSPGMQGLLRQVQPTRFADVAAVLALYRPGPMGVGAHTSYARRATGRENIDYVHPELEEVLSGVLEETYGLIVFQEQVLEVLKVAAGYDMTSAAGIFNAMRKKIRAKLDEAEPEFKERMSARGYSEECATALWSTLVPFADYSFNKSHSAGYGIVAYWTAYLKANHPVEFMAALLGSEEDPDKLKEYLAECNRMGIEVLPPDINTSEAGWTPVGGAIRYGLTSIKGIKEKAYNIIKKGRPYKSLADYFERVLKTGLNGRTLDALVRSGAFDTLCPNREGLYASYEELAARALAAREAGKASQSPLVPITYDVREADRSASQRQAWENELLGTILTTKTVVLKTSRPLGVDEYEYINEVISHNPGNSPVVLQIRKITTVTLNVTMTLSTSAIQSFEALGVKAAYE